MTDKIEKKQLVEKDEKIEKKQLVEKTQNKSANGTYYRRMKNIQKQYGKHMKAYENNMLEMKESDYLINLFKKHGLPISGLKRAPSIIHSRWGFESAGEKNRINEVDDIAQYIKTFEENNNVSNN